MLLGLVIGLQSIYADNYRLAAIDISGNKHTHDYIVLREIPLEVGATYSELELNEGMQLARQQLNNTSLFGLISVNYLQTDTQEVVLQVELTERWYIFPVPIFELADRNFNVWWNQFGRDLRRVNYGLNVIHYNLTGHYDDFRIKGQWGFTPKFELSYERPYIGADARHGLSAEGSFSMNRRAVFDFVENRESFITTDDFALRRLRVAGRHSYRQGNFIFHRTELKFNHNRISDSLLSLNPDFFTGDRTNQSFLTLTYRLRYNRVDNKAYPLKGKFHEFSAAKVGLGLFGDLDQVILRAKTTYFQPLGANFYFGTQLSGKVAFAANHPWHNLEGLGYCQDFVRGYDLYAIGGQHFALHKTNLKFKLFNVSLPNPLKKASGFNGIPFAFYLKGYFDQGYVVDNVYADQNPLTNQWLAGGGLGLDVVTFYDWVFRFEYSYNRLGEKGLFLHFVLDLNTYEDCSLW